MTKEDKVIRMSENLDLRPSTAAIAVEMLDKQKEFLMALAENEYDSGFSKAIDRVLETIDRHIDFTRDCHEDISPLMGLRRDIEQMKNEDMV